jgi:hypothetical protein
MQVKAYKTHPEPAKPAYYKASELIYQSYQLLTYSSQDDPSISACTTNVALEQSEDAYASQAWRDYFLTHLPRPLVAVAFGLPLDWMHVDGYSLEKSRAYRC